jgi:hypothetical protein
MVAAGIILLLYSWADGWKSDWQPPVAGLLVVVGIISWSEGPHD